MILYTTLLLLCFLSVVIAEREGLNNASRDKKCKKYFLIIVIYMILLCGLRSYSTIYHIGMDTHGYYESYITWGNRSIHDCFDPEVNDKGYAVLQWFFARVLHLPFTIALIIFSAVYIGIMGLYIYTYSSNKIVSILIFVAMGLYTFAFSAIRQSLAMGICLAAYMYSDKHAGLKGFLVFVLLVWLADTLHASAIIFLGAYFLQKIRMDTKYIILFLIAAAGVFVFKEQAAELVMRLAAETSEKYGDYAENILIAERNAGMRLYIFIAFIILLRMIFMERIYGDEKNDNLVYMMLIVLVIFPTTQTGGAIMRIYYYFYMFIVVYLPNVIESIKIKNEKGLVYFVLSIFLMWYYFSTTLSGGRLVPYYFFWR